MCITKHQGIRTYMHIKYIILSRACVRIMYISMVDTTEIIYKNSLGNVYGNMDLIIRIRYFFCFGKKKKIFEHDIIL